MTRSREELGVLATHRIDGKRLAAEHRGDIVRMQTGGVDNDPRQKLLAVCTDLDTARTRRAPDDPRPRQKMDVTPGRVRQLSHERLGLDDTGRG